MNNRIKCSCGDTLLPSYYKKHIRTERHKNNLEITSYNYTNSIILFCEDNSKIILH